MIRVERATEDHARAIAPRLKLFNCCGERAHGETFEELAVNHVRTSHEAWCWLEGDLPLALAGVVPRNILAGHGFVWMLPSNEAFASPRVFLLFSRAVAGYLKHEYSRVDGIVDCEFTASIRWLRKLGFVVGEEPFTALGRKYLPFIMER